eukprot:2680867-Pyramimonas_sp.AAC.1
MRTMRMRMIRLRGGWGRRKAALRTRGPPQHHEDGGGGGHPDSRARGQRVALPGRGDGCLLYTSDAADDTPCVDL